MLALSSKYIHNPVPPNPFHPIILVQNSIASYTDFYPWAVFLYWAIVSIFSVAWVIFIKKKKTFCGTKPYMTSGKAMRDYKCWLSLPVLSPVTHPHHLVLKPNGPLFSFHIKSMRRLRDLSKYLKCSLPFILPITLVYFLQRTCKSL